MYVIGRLTHTSLVHFKPSGAVGSAELTIGNTRRREPKHAKRCAHLIQKFQPAYADNNELRCRDTCSRIMRVSVIDAFAPICLETNTVNVFLSRSDSVSIVRPLLELARRWEQQFQLLDVRRMLPPYQFVAAQRHNRCIALPILRQGCRWVIPQLCSGARNAVGATYTYIVPMCCLSALGSSVAR